MDIQEIEKLMAAMNEYKIHKLAIKDESGEILLEQKTGAPAPMAACYELPQAVHAGSPSPAPAKEKVVEGTFVTSPIVGTFYSASSPDQPPFVKVGDRVTGDTVVCIVEAMKVMNEVKSGVTGVIAEILVKNGDPVEFGTKILRVT